MKLNELLKHSDRPFFIREGESGDPEILFLTDDSRQAGPGALFAATRTGRDFVGAALNAGISGLLVSRQQVLPERPSPGVVVLSGRRRPDAELGHLAAVFHGFPSRSLHVVAVTGTNGKTTTTHMLYFLWRKAGYRCALIGTLGVRYFDGYKEAHFETGFTTPRSYELQKILSDLVKARITHVAIEASSEALSLGRLEGLKVDTALFTGFGRDHLDHHQTLAAYLRAKRHLFFLTVRQDAPAFFVYREPTAEESLRRFARRVLRRRANAKGTDLPVRIPHGRPTSPDIQWIEEKDLDSARAAAQPVPTRFNRINGMLALRAAERSGVVRPDLSDFPGVSGRMEHIGLAPGVDAFVDYAHSPDALERVLTEVRGIGYGQVIVVFGCGGDRDAGKRSLMGAIAARLADVALITDDNPRTEEASHIRAQIGEGARNAGGRGDVREIGNRSAAIRLGVELALQSESAAQGFSMQRRTALVIAGKGHEEYQIIGKEKHPFSDREELQRSRALLLSQPLSSDSSVP